ncbi:uncharacterized protein LOC105789559 [Gossypium raimondii]|uniref:uncharacterized protein LOC105789559 n=1 Tax=Gossypium raimondii TaxID=29730 RepID=UPI00063A9415|nr:uncharacterized protein LOC105789559 [Gossypium raimondii]
MPNYVKFMKEILSKKERLENFGMVALTKECSTYLQDKLPPKMKDLRCFTIPCNIGATYYDFEVDKEVSIILGRPFLATGRTLIDVEKGELTIRVQDDQITFNVFKYMRFPDIFDDYFSVSELEDLAVEWELNSVEDPLEQVFDVRPTK